ncbi:MAG: GIY-YIG nuclease family protein [Flammeovirgaceae bacterium]|nr:GIY-YIG nuclease family protein [Flammeovirgaceae bacterium]
MLFSSKFDKIYIGYTSNLIQRFYSHNFLSKKGYTVRYRPWEVIHVEFLMLKKQAINREKHLKTGFQLKQVMEFDMNPYLIKLVAL